MTAAKAFTIDSNILIYAFDPTHQEKHRISLRIVTAMLRLGCPMLLQCLSEFYSVTTRKRFLTVKQASSLVEGFQTAVSVVSAGPGELKMAMQIHQTHSLQFFDCMILATAARAGCTLLFSEDMNDGQFIRGTEIVNPFDRSMQQLDSLISFRS